MRRSLVAGNWKMNGSLEQCSSLLSGLTAATAGCSAEVLVCPPYVYLETAARELRDSYIGLGGQNCHEASSGAFTGEIAAGMLVDLGCDYVIVGHSERRSLFGDSDERVAAKYQAALGAGIQPILCVGETLAERDAGDAIAVVAAQLDAVFANCPIDSATVVAYEPVWAIGTGRTATPEQAQEVHAAIRGKLLDRAGESADSVRILYGGSVKADNAAELFSQRDIDGGLIGGASLKQEEFAAIVKAAT